MNDKDFEALISKYSNELLSLSNSPSYQKALAENRQEQEQTQPLLQETDPSQPDTAEVLPDTEESLTEMTDFALFSAGIFTASGAYGIPDARIEIYRDGKLHRFLITDSSGNTEKVKLEAYPKENSLEPEGENKALDYYADVSAPGFAPRKGLLVSAVGGSEILLSLQLTPLEAPELKS